MTKRDGEKPDSLTYGSQTEYYGSRGFNPDPHL